MKYKENSFWQLRLKHKNKRPYTIRFPQSKKKEIFNFLNKAQVPVSISGKSETAYISVR